jgi:checkpoint serine/threonine-protein kinase
LQKQQPKQVPEHHVREAVNPRTGRRERVFVDLESVYPDPSNPAHEVSFEELRALKRGWMSKNWRSQKGPLRQISGNAGGVDVQSGKSKPSPVDEELVVREDRHSQSHDQEGVHEGKSGKSRRLKVKEVKGETQTGKLFARFC